jgi:hypothetical protein
LLQAEAVVAGIPGMVLVVEVAVRVVI